jgi:hypothetical protein
MYPCKFTYLLGGVGSDILTSTIRALIIVHHHCSVCAFLTFHRTITIPTGGRLRDDFSVTPV